MEGILVFWNITGWHRIVRCIVVGSCSKFSRSFFLVSSFEKKRNVNFVTILMLWRLSRLKWYIFRGRFLPKRMVWWWRRKQIQIPRLTNTTSSAMVRKIKPQKLVKLKAMGPGCHLFVYTVIIHPWILEILQGPEASFWTSGVIEMDGSLPIHHWFFVDFFGQELCRLPANAVVVEALPTPLFLVSFFAFSASQWSPLDIFSI